MRRVLQVYGRVGEGRGKYARKSAEQGRGYTWGDRRKLETFESRVDWTNPSTPEAASVAPIGKPDTLRVRYCIIDVLPSDANAR